MLIQIAEVFSADEAATLRQRLEAADWVDGKVTAGHQSAAVKHNRQLSERHPLAQELGDLILQRLSGNNLFMSAALPRKIFPPLFNRYEGGEAFGYHVDNAVRGTHEANPILRLTAGEALGTLLVAQTPPLAARKQWLADHLQLAGRLILDDGAVQALKSGKSLLPVGIVAIDGEFERGAAVACIAPDGHEVARGLANYGSGEARLIARKSTADIESILGYLDEPEMIHRDNLILGD